MALAVLKGITKLRRNPSDYIARKKEKEEEEQKEKGRFPRRSKSSTDKDYAAKRRSYVIEKEDSDKRSKRGSYTFDHSFDTEPKYKQDRLQRRSLKASDSQIPKPIKVDTTVKHEPIKKARAPQPPVSPERPKSPAPQPPSVKQQELPSSSTVQSLPSTSDVTSPRVSTEPKVESTQSQKLIESEVVLSVSSSVESKQDITVPQIISPRESRPKPPRQSLQQNSIDKEPDVLEEKESKVSVTEKPNRPPRKKKELAPQPSIPDKTFEEVSDHIDKSEITTHDNHISDQIEIEDNRVTEEEVFTQQQSDIVESGTYTFKQIEIINPDKPQINTVNDNSVDTITADNYSGFVNNDQSENNIKGILKKKNQDKLVEIDASGNIEYSDEKISSQEDITSDNLMNEDLDEREITPTGKSLPDALADTVSLTSLTSVESVPPPLPESIPPLLPDIPPPTPVLSRKIEVRQSDINIEKKSDSYLIDDAEVEEEIVQIESSSQVQSAALVSREEVISPHSQKVAELRAEFFGINKSPPPVVAMEEPVPETTGMDVYLNDLQLEAKTKELEDADSDISESEDDENDRVEFKAVFIPGDGKTGILPTSADEGDGSIHLISYNATSLQSPESTTDSAFEDMASSMLSNDFDNSNQVSLSSTLDDFSDGFVVKETFHEVRREYVESDPGSMSPPESSLSNAGLKSIVSPRSNKSVIEKANKFSSVINEPPKITIKTNSKEMSTAHIQEVDAQRKAVIQSSTMKRKTVGFTDEEEAPNKPSIEVQKSSNTWRENSKTINGINWEEKPEKVDLYSKNIIPDSETTETVDSESIADLSSTRNRWESFYRSTSDEPIKPKKNPTTAKRWEVRLPYKSDNHQQAPVPDSQNKMSDTDPYANESAIDREIRLANEREEMLKKEQEERLELIKRQSESKQNFQNKSNNNSKEFQTMYHEMTEADRGSELQKREIIIKQEIMENEEREKALKTRTNEDESDNETTESAIDKEIRLQREREEEFSSQKTNGEPQTNGDDLTYEEAIGTYQHEGESLIAKELRELRDREEELQRQRNSAQQMARTTQKPHEKSSVPPIQKSATPPVQKQQKPPTPTVNKSFNAFLSSQSVQSAPQTVENNEQNVKKVTKKETPIEREIRLARERENELRLQKGLPPLKEAETKKEVIIEQEEEEVGEITYRRYPASSDTQSMRQFSSSRLQNELQKQKEREMMYRKEGKIMTTSEEHIEPMKYTEVPTKLTGPVKRNFVIRKSVTEKPTVENGEAESKNTKTVASPPQPTKEEPKFRLKTGGAAFSYRETRQHAESKIEKELREMREREEELKKQRRSSGVILDS